MQNSKMYWAVAVVVTILVMAAAAAGPIMSRVEQPEYKITASEGSIEIREYGPMIAAEAEVKGERKPAISEGFRLIAAYIFGANAPNTKIAMTAPVEQQRHQKIAMTAPVTQQAGSGAWTVRFIMPKSWIMETLPAPTDARVKLVAVLAKRMVVIRFSGTTDDGLIAAKTTELRKYAENSWTDDGRRAGPRLLQSALDATLLQTERGHARADVAALWPSDVCSSPNPPIPIKTSTVDLARFVAPELAYGSERCNNCTCYNYIDGGRWPNSRRSDTRARMRLHAALSTHVYMPLILRLTP